VLKQHKPWVDKEMFKIIRQKEEGLTTVAVESTANEWK
jgi:hypothetical protein